MLLGAVFVCFCLARASCKSGVCHPVLRRRHTLELCRGWRPTNHRTAPKESEQAQQHTFAASSCCRFVQQRPLKGLDE